jgi:RNA polymerase sigma factor (TIGR02999 family)
LQAFSNVDKFDIAAQGRKGALMSEPMSGVAPAGVDVPNSSGELLPQLYAELRKLAVHRLARERPGQTLQATALVHEAWLRLENSPKHRWNGRAHFFAAAAEAMRRILVDNARRKQRLKHGGDRERVEIEAVELVWCNSACFTMGHLF